MKTRSPKINNEFYKRNGDIWWNADEPLNLLESVLNPARTSYFKRIIFENLKLNAKSMTALEVGCGGGILCEQIARMGFATTGVDPSPAALATADAHARKQSLEIQYVPGQGESLPFAIGTFDAVFCCDVLEHVSDLDRTIAEISRVLKPGGYFFYDTINRTPVSKLVAIKVWQDWKAFAFMPENLHVWEMFIKPRELHAHFSNHGLANGDIVGLAPAVNPLVMLYYLNQRVKGRIGMREMGNKIKLKESRDKSMLYAGWAIKGPFLS